MPVRRLFALLVVTFALLVSVPTAVAAEGTPTTATDAATPAATPATGPGSISGTVKNGTPDGGDVSGLKVELTRFQGTNQAQTWQTTTKDDGTYEFKNLPVNDGESYIATVTYEKVLYQTDLIVLSQNPQTTADIDVYEPTTDPSVITVQTRGVVISGVEPGLPQLDLFEIVSLDNSSKRAYVGTDGVVLTVPLPEGASQIIPQPGFDFGQPSVKDGKLITTGAIVPGSHDATFAYTVPYTGSKTVLNIGSSMPTGSLSVLIKEDTYKIESPSMHDAGTIDLSGSTFHVLSIEKPVVGDIVAVTVSGLPKGGATSDSDRGPLYAALAAGAGILVAGGLIFQLVRRRRMVPAAAGAGGAAALTAADASDERMALAAELNKLEDDHSSGAVDDETYQRERQEILDELREISRERRGLEGEAG